MDPSTVRKSGLAVSAAAGFALVAIGVPLAIAAPTAAPPSDGQGYVNSTARCTAPDTAVIFGATDTSRVAICKTAGGEYQYRGVRVSDGAKLIAAATQTAGNTFVVKYDGATYTVTPQALSVTINGDTFRTETWADYHGPQAPASGSNTPSTSTSSTTSATTSATATATTPASSAPSTSSAPKTSAAPSTSAAPLPPPLPAEVGAGTSATG
ncbi:MAG: hypothetical protein K8R24_15180 [Mycobacterium sp.]|nr:hypothetical protein [Mycobacterium sp.]